MDFPSSIAVDSTLSSTTQMKKGLIAKTMKVKIQLISAGWNKNVSKEGSPVKLYTAAGWASLVLQSGFHKTKAGIYSEVSENGVP